MCLAIAFCDTTYALLRHTDVISFLGPKDKVVTSMLVFISFLVVQLHISVYHTWKILSRLKNQRIILSGTMNLNKVLKNKEWFLEFEKQLKQEYSIENLNFLVSCIQYRRTAMLLGSFEYESSATDTSSESDSFDQLNWREFRQNTTKCEPGILIKMAQDIFDEYCQQGAPQEISLSKQTATTLSIKIENLSYFCG